jgi:uncharacterized protein YjbI with pentapeptide repeats
MPQVHTLRKIAPTIIALTLLAAAADVSIFHRADITKHLQAALARIPPRFFEPAVALLAGLALLGLLIILRRLASGVASSVRYLWAPRQSYEGIEPKERITLENDLRANRIQVITTVVQALGGIAVVIGIYFAWANLKTTQEAEKDTQKSQAETIRLTNEGQITDRFTKAIDQLGSPQLELRLGGIYALERIARDSEKDHWPIMEVLTTFVRAHAPVVKTGDLHSVPAAAPSPDIQAILTVIGRRERSYEKGKNERLNLNEANLARADLIGAQLSNTDLEGANLTEAALNNASLNNASLTKAGLERADLTHADLTGSNMLGADLRDAILLGAHLGGANLVAANLMKTDLLGADLVQANLESANLANANLEDANLAHADLENADLTRANLKNANLSGADLEIAPGQVELNGIVAISQDQVNSARGDKNTVLPTGIVMPESWKHQTAAAATAGTSKSP